MIETRGRFCFLIKKQNRPLYSVVLFMKIFRNSLIILLLMLTPAWPGVSSSLWQTKKSQHFVVYYQEAPEDFVDELIARAEDYYNGIVDDLGFRRMDFWSWDNRAKIYLYNNADGFHNDTQRSEWAGAVVSVNNRTIKTFVGQESFFDSILPHEMTHIIFREFIGAKASLPLWIDEGVAGSQEQSNLKTRLEIARGLVAKEQYIKLDKFSEIYTLGDITPYVFYSQAASLIVFLIKEQGREGFLDFSRALRDGADWKKAIASVYHFSSLEEMEKEWIANLEGEE